MEIKTKEVSLNFGQSDVVREISIGESIFIAYSIAYFYSKQKPPSFRERGLSF